MTYKQDLQFLTGLIPEEVQNDSTYLAVQRLIALAEYADEKREQS